ncbi:MAG: hypothetical protein IPL83_08150 [Bdellovibrionales bacterium]|nr:hypothetical protein [Bdellovibrionales bacterium]
MSFEFTQKMSGEVFRETKSYIILIFPVLFFLRLLYLNMTAASARDYGDLLKGAALFLALLLSYEYLLSLTFDFSRALEGDMSEHARERVLSSQKSPIPTPGLSMIRKTLGLLSSILYYLAQGLFVIALIFMSALAPIVFLFGTVLSMPSLIKIFFFLILIGSSWPLMFSVFDRVGGTLMQSDLKSESLIFSWAIDFLIELFKIIGPLSFCKILLQSPFGSSALSSLSFGARSAGRIAGGFGHASAYCLPPQGQSLKQRYSPHRSPARLGHGGSNGSAPFGSRAMGSRSLGSGFNRPKSNGSGPIGIGVSQNGRHMDQPACSMESYERLSEDDSSPLPYYSRFRGSADLGKGPSSPTASHSSNMTSHKKGKLGKSPESSSGDRGFNVSKSDHGLAQLSESKREISGAASYLSNHSDLTGPIKKKNSNSQMSSPASQSNRGFRNQALTDSHFEKRARETMKERTRT